MDEGGSYEYEVEVLNYYLHSLFLFCVTMLSHSFIRPSHNTHGSLQAI